MARTTTSEECQELGRRYYRLKHYEKAIETLSQGIESSPTLGLYDHRAAAYDKLGDSNNAVKDGREMIKLDKKEIKGYLRTASILQKMDKPDTALSIYKYGMKNVPTTDKNFKLLQQLHDKLTRKLSPSTAIDPLTVLPVELAEMILEYLSFRQMVNCMRVSRGWRDYVSKMPKLWVHLDLSGARRPVPRSFVNKAVRRSESRVSRITVHRFEHVDMLKNIAKMCKELADIEVISLPHIMSETLVEIASSASNLRKLTIRPEITSDAATSIMQCRPEFEIIHFGAVKQSRYSLQWRGGPWLNLKSLELNYVDQVLCGQIELPQLFVQAPNLEILRLNNVSGPGWPNWHEGTSKLTTLELRRAGLVFTQALPSTLQRLAIEDYRIFNLYNAGIIPLRCHLPHLTHLTMHNLAGINADKLEELLSLCIADENGKIHDSTNNAPLQSFSLHGALHADTTFHALVTGLSTQVPRLFTPALKSLDFAALPCDDDSVEALLTCDLALETIDLSYTNITGASIKMLADKLSSLKVIRADNCHRINGRDAIAYAQQKGIHVNYGMGEGNGERRVRYG